MSHAVRLPLPPKHDTVSQPVRAWNIGKATQRSGPSASAISWAGKYRKFFPAPMAIHSSVMLRRWADATARTITSMSTVRMDTLLYPCFIASSMWSRIRVSASSWVHGARSRDWVHSTPVWHVLMTCLSVAMVAALVAKNKNNSILLSLMRRNSCQFPGIVLDGSTRRRIPFPLSVFVFWPSSYLRYIHPTQHLVCSRVPVAMWCTAGTLGSRNRKMSL